MIYFKIAQFKTFLNYSMNSKVTKKKEKVNYILQSRAFLEII